MARGQDCERLGRLPRIMIFLFHAIRAQPAISKGMATYTATRLMRSLAFAVAYRARCR